MKATCLKMYILHDHSIFMNFYSRLIDSIVENNHNSVYLRL